MSGTDAILKQIQSALEHEPRVNIHSHPIHIGFSNGALVVEGEVQNVAAKKRALQLAGAVNGVRSLLLTEPTLQNCTLRIRAKGQIESLHEVAGEMGGDPSGAIVVSVEEGVITLDGQVISLSHKRLAGVLAWCMRSRFARASAITW